ncbi:arginase [Sporomusa acidovorans]|uniref:Arginase n=1 Tax=Sporomusa acidovorans (strain ATCC 49682 / DSM 3132 / Mol) TaxID=1123286 RepID=A0ABZ3J9Q6_SPOA4|nr:arginase [Sporomusa acidovorans]SDF43432.1 arginase [Sporomusa acidovorans]
MRKITVIGVPMWLGQTCFGTQLGPGAIRATGLNEYLQSTYFDVVDAGDLPFITQLSTETPVADGTIRNFEAVLQGTICLHEKISAIVANGRFPLILGGDHSIAIGSIAGIARHYHNLGVIWYDAHADSNTPETSPSGNIQGMPLAASLGFGHPRLTGIGGYRKKVKAENIVLLGVRDLDPGERLFIRDQGIKIFSPEDIYHKGIGSIIEETIAYLTKRCDGIHLSFDLDVIDPCEACGVGTPVADGVAMKNNLEAMSLLAQHNIITSAEFVELNPLLDKDGQTAAAASALIRTLLKN